MAVPRRCRNIPCRCCPLLISFLPPVFPDLPLSGNFLTLLTVYTTVMRFVLKHRAFLAIATLFLSAATMGVAVELHHCHGMRAKFNAGTCEMSGRETCSEHGGAVTLTAQGTCCENHTFTLTSGDPYALSGQKLHENHLSKILNFSLWLSSDDFPDQEPFHTLKFLPNVSALHRIERVYLLNRSLLI